MPNYKAVDTEVLESGLTAIADALRDKSGSTELLSFPDGMAEEAAAVYEAGKQAEYDAFWDMYQENGNRTDYRYAFAYTKWDDVTFNPKYPLKFTGDAGYAFVGTVFEWPNRVLQVDLSDATSIAWTFRNNLFHHLGKCDLRSAASAYQTFSMCTNLETIEEIVTHADLQWNTPFAMTNCLKEVRFSGVIGQSGLDLSPASGLSHDSIVSVIGALSGSTSGLTVTLPLAAVNTAFETAAGAADGSASEAWLALAASKTNWTISLA